MRGVPGTRSIPPVFRLFVVYFFVVKNTIGQFIDLIHSFFVFFVRCFNVVFNKLEIFLRIQSFPPVIKAKLIFILQKNPDLFNQILLYKPYA